MILGGPGIIRTWELILVGVGKTRIWEFILEELE